MKIHVKLCGFSLSYVKVHVNVYVADDDGGKRRRRTTTDGVGPICYTVTGRLHGMIVGPTGRTDSSRTAHICQSNQCGLLYRLRCSVIGRPTGQSVRPVGRSVHTLRQSDRQSDEIKHPTVCPTGRTKRLHDTNTIVGPSDDRNV